MSQITTHILDTTRGKPAKGVSIELYQQLKMSDNKEVVGWKKLSSGLTDNDGRISNLLSEETILSSGIYRMHFKTEDYFKSNHEKGFYPFVDIVFELNDSGEHYHIPLLLTAFGYSTYRGS